MTPTPERPGAGGTTAGDVASGPHSARALRAVLDAARPLDRALDFPAVTRLLAPLSDDEVVREPELALIRAAALFAMAEPKRALALVTRVAPACARWGNSPILRRCRMIEAGIRMDLGDASLAEHLALEVSDLSAQADDEPRSAMSSNCLGVLSCLRCEWDEAIGRFERAIVLYRKNGMVLPLVQALYNNGLAYCEMAHFDKADARFEEASAHVHVAEEPAVYLAILRAYQAGLLGDLPRAESAARRSLALSVRRRLRAQGDCLWILGLITYWNCRFGEARALFLEGIALTRLSGRKWLEADLHGALAELELEAGNPEAAAASAGEAVRLFRAIGSEARAAKVGNRYPRPRCAV